MNPVEKYIVLCNYYERLYKNRVGHYVTSVAGHNHNTQFDIRYMQTIKLYKPFFALLALNENFCKVSGIINIPGTHWNHIFCEPVSLRAGHRQLSKCPGRLLRRDTPASAETCLGAAADNIYTYLLSNSRYLLSTDHLWVWQHWRQLPHCRPLSTEAIVSSSYILLFLLG